MVFRETNFVDVRCSAGANLLCCLLNLQGGLQWTSADGLVDHCLMVYVDDADVEIYHGLSSHRRESRQSGGVTPSVSSYVFNSDSSRFPLLLRPSMLSI